MSGTSLDGVDAVVVDFAQLAGLQRSRAHGEVNSERSSAVMGHAHRPFSNELKAELLALNQPGDNELHRASLATRGLAEVYHEAIAAALNAASVSASRVEAAGVHGQTVRHRPLPADGGYTCQLDPGAWLSSRLGMDVVSDFRSQDVALGGQGAPLVPAFHDQILREAGTDVAVINLGGMANITWLPSDGPTVGYDTGPGNALLDAWCLRHEGKPFDAAGQWAAGGAVIEGLLALWLSDAYFAAPAPKSTGRDHFNMAWAEDGLARWRLGQGLLAARPVDVQATLTELTAVTCTAPLRSPGGSVQHRARRVWVCGGGARNTELLRRMAAQLPGTPVTSTADAGWPVDQVEAIAFAWLARQRVKGIASTMPAVTGANTTISAGAWRRHGG